MVSVLFGDSLISMSLLRLRIPNDHVDAVRYLDQVQCEVIEEIDAARASVYFDSRLEGRFEQTLQAGTTSRKRALRMVRGLNNRMGRPIRWRDDLDRSSSQ